MPKVVEDYSICAQSLFDSLCGWATLQLALGVTMNLPV